MQQIYRGTPKVAIKLLYNFIEITLWHGRSPVNLLYIFRTPSLKHISGWLLLRFLTEKNNTLIRTVFLENLNLFVLENDNEVFLASLLKLQASIEAFLIPEL